MSNSTSGPIQPNVPYTITNQNSGLTWAVQGNDPDDGTSVVQFQKNTGANQQWKFVANPGGFFIMSCLNDRYAGIDHDNHGNNAGVNMYSPSEFGSNVWLLSSTNVGDVITIRNATTGKFCDVLKQGTDNDNYIVQYDANGESSQNWTITPA